MVVLAVWLGVLSACDLRWRRLPNLLTLPGFAVIVAAAGLDGRGAAAVVGAAVLAAVYLIGFVLGGFGGGDVKLALGLGAATGATGIDVWVLSALGAPVLTLLLAALMRSRVVPHGPSMCLATGVVLVIAG
jgi:leader peptidase (prepilin peptidase) / N-methyltransferase